VGVVVEPSGNVSSLLSPQSLSPSFRKEFGILLPLLHWNRPLEGRIPQSTLGRLTRPEGLVGTRPPRFAACSWLASELRAARLLASSARSPDDIPAPPRPFKNAPRSTCLFLREVRSSLPSGQSRSPSPTKLRGMQWALVQENSLDPQDTPSSLPSPQSLSPSLRKTLGIQRVLSQRNCPR